MDLIVCSLEPWDQTWRRNQFLLDGLLRNDADLRVLLVEPTSDPVHLLRIGNRPKLGRGLIEMPGYEGRLHRLELTKYLPRSAGPWADLALRRGVISAARRLGMTAPVLWINDPSWAHLVTATAWPALYDITDDWVVADRPPREHERIVANERVLMEECRAVVVCSPSLQQCKSAIRPVELVQNAVDVTAYREGRPRPEDLGDGQVVLYVGTLHEDRLDVDLCCRISEQLTHHGASMVFVGPNALRADNTDMLIAAGARVLGPRPNSMIPAYMQHADVLTVPHKVDEFTNSLDPIKLYEYQAVGRPIAATPVAGFVELRGTPGVAIETAEFLPEAIVGLLRTPPALVGPFDVADWSDRVARMGAVLRTVAGQGEQVGEDESQREPAEVATGPSVRLPAETRILDIGTPDHALADALARRGMLRYLGLVEPWRYDSARADAGELAARLHPLDDPEVVARSSADLLVLRRGYESLIWGWPALSHFRYVAFEGDPSGWGTKLATRLADWRGRMRPAGRWEVDEQHTFSLFAMDQIREQRARTYFSPAWGVAGLAEQLQGHQIDYAVLRWFDALPHIDPGEDLDILVRDEDVARFRQLVESEPGIVPIDLYSVTGIDGADFRGAAYYVPELAERILDNAVRHPSGVQVPSPEDHLYSLAYHALYHKGYGSGLVSVGRRGDEQNDHDYGAALTQAADICGVELPLDMESMDEHLGAQGWRPPLDALRRLSAENEWLAKRLERERAENWQGAEPAVFLVRERAIEHIELPLILSVLEELGFGIVAVEELDEPARARTAASIRGGNWGKGPYPVSGGGPLLVIVCLHYAPEPVDPALRDRYPHLSNADILHAKLAVREYVEKLLGPENSFNAMHSADDPDEAWEYLRIAVPDAVGRIRDDVEVRIQGQLAPQGTRETLSRGRRARVDVVVRHGVPVVRKTFTDAGMRHYHREVAAFDELSKSTTFVPEILARGNNWFETRYVANTLPSYTARLLPLSLVRKMVTALREVYERGFDLVDAKPDNFLCDVDGQLYLVDLEFAYRMANNERSFIDGPAFRTPTPGVYEDIPVGDSSYVIRWLPRVGMPAHVMAGSGVIVQHLHRLGYRAYRASIAPGSRPRRAAGNMRSRAREVIRDSRHAAFEIAVGRVNRRQRRNAEGDPRKKAGGE